MYQRYCLHGIVKSISVETMMLVHNKPSYHRLKAICRVSSLMIVVMVTMKKEQNTLKAVSMELYVHATCFLKSQKNTTKCFLFYVVTD